MKNLVTKVAKAIDKAKVKLMVAEMILVSNPVAQAWATTTPSAHVDGDKSKAENIVKKAAGSIVSVFPWFGAFFVVSGFFKLIMAYRNDNPEAQPPAIKDIVIGAVLVAFGFLWNPIADLIF